MKRKALVSPGSGMADPANTFRSIGQVSGELDRTGISSSNNSGIANDSFIFLFLQFNLHFYFYPTQPSFEKLTRLAWPFFFSCFNEISSVIQCQSTLDTVPRLNAIPPGTNISPSHVAPVLAFLICSDLASPAPSTLNHAS